MVKKKRQSDPGENGDESTESCDESVKSACPHVAKAVDLTRLKKTLKGGGYDKECSECKKSNIKEVSDPDYEEDLSLWMCLRCGSQLCGRTRNKHALNHFNTPHSDCHALTVNTTTWDIYCYNCSNEITASSSKKLHECIEYLKKLAVAGGNSKSLPPIELPFSQDSKLDLPTVETIVKIDPLSNGKEKAIFNLQRVRGLTNLGNTCFFNSVMQCLVQTPYLLQVLQEMANPGERFTLPGGSLKLKGENGDEGKEVELPPITGQLAEWGTLTKTLAETLSELQAGEGGVYTPRKLLSALVNKLPQFGGGDQHDAHELLRHLLEAVRSEDLRRYQSVILSSLGMNSKVDPSKVDEEVKQKVKFYGQQASDTMLRPEQVFRGFLVSTLECQECFHQSDRAEYFLDLSLPVATCRPQPPAVVRRKTPNEDNTYNAQEENKPSKHQLKKKKDRASVRNAARKNKGNSTSKEESPTAETNGPSKSDGKSSSEQSDADVEDNLEDAPRQPDTHSVSVGTQAGQHTAANFAAYHMESGYNSEKVISSDSIRTSPVELDRDKAEAAERGVIALQYKPLGGDASNPDSGVASPEATKHNSSEAVDEPPPARAASPASRPASRSASPSAAGGELERPVSRRSFGPPYSNEVVSLGISAAAGRSLAQHEAADLSDHLDKLKLYMEAPRAASPASPPPASLAPLAPLPPLAPLAPLAPRYVCHEDECSVHSCLAQFTALELLTGNNKVGCDTCTARQGPGAKTVYTNATKRFLVSSPPAILILHLKRFQIGPRCMFRKMSKHVEFPTVLELAPFCAMEKARRLAQVSRAAGELPYALYGVVEHSGGMHGGHYVAYVKVRAPLRPADPRWAFVPRGPLAAAARVAAAGDGDSDSDLSGYESGEAPTPDPPAGKWYYVSDSMVSEVSEEKVLRAQAYLLFYERIQ